MNSPLDQPATKRDVDELAGQIIGAITETLKEYATKEDMKHLSTKIDKVEERLGAKIDNLGSDVSNLRDRVIDLELKQGSRHTA